MITMLLKKHLEEMHPALKQEVFSFCRKAKKIDAQVEILIEDDRNYTPAIRKMTARTPKELRNMKEKERNTFVVPQYYIDLLN